MVDHNLPIGGNLVSKRNGVTVMDWLESYSVGKFYK